MRSDKPVMRTYALPRRITFSAFVFVLSSGYLALLGWMFFGVGMIPFWFLGVNGDYSMPLFYFNVGHADARIIDVEATQYTEEETEMGPWYVVRAFTYTFRSADGVLHKSISYGVRFLYQPGDIVDIEYLNYHPSMSRIQDMRRTPESFGNALLADFFPLFGLIMVISFTFMGLRNLYLLRWGEVYDGVAVQRSDNLTEVMPVLHDPAHPERILRPDSLPGSPRIDTQGLIYLGDYCPIRLLMVLLIPIIIMTVNALYLYLNFIR